MNYRLLRIVFGKTSGRNVLLSKPSTYTILKETIKSYYAALMAELPALYTPNAFCRNQVLPLVAEEVPVPLSKKITYYIEELDKLETIPACLLEFCGYEAIDAEHYFFFFKADPNKLYGKFKKLQRILRATIALVPIQGFRHLLVQHVEAIPENCFIKDHQPLISYRQPMAG